MIVHLNMTKPGKNLLLQASTSVTIFDTHGLYDIPEDVLRREGLAFLERLTTLHEDNTKTVADV